MEPSEGTLCIGQKFYSYSAWDNIFKNYKQKNKLAFTTNDCHKLKKNSDLDESIVDMFKYADIKFTCKFGPSRSSQSTKYQTR